MACLQVREDEAKAHGLVVDQKLKQDFRNKYIVN